MYERLTHKSSALFRAFVSGMLEEMGDQVGIPDGMDADEAVWNHLRGKLKELCRKQDSRVNMCQWMSIHRATNDLLPLWTEMMFKTVLLCIEMNFFANGAYKKNFLVRKSDIDGDGGASARTTSSKVMQVDDRLLKSCGVNAAV